MKRLTTLGAMMLASTLVPAPSRAQTGTPAGKTTTKRPARKSPSKKKESAESVLLHELLEKVNAQQAQIDAMKAQLAARDQQVQTAQQSVNDAQTQAATASSAAQQALTAAQAATVKADTLATSVDQVKAADQGLQETMVANQARIEDEIQSPTTLHYKGVTITPVAFFALEGVWRQRALNSDINTPFNNIPFPSANEGHISELNFSGRQSRIGGLFEGNAGRYKLSGYFETDFLGVGTSSNNNQSDSYVLRQRQFWGKGEIGGFAVTGGQMWSLVTETGLSTNTRTEKLPNTIDPQYMVGYSWTRQPALRLQQRFGDVKTGMFTAAMSLEQAQITNFTAAGTIPTAFLFAGIGQNGGLYNAAGNIGSGNTAGTGAITTYANNVAPDVIVKGTLDYTHAHFELGGIARFMRDYYFPVTAYTGTAAAPTYTYSATQISHTAPAGGAFASARVTVNKYVDVAVQAMGGQGVGRYGSSQLADATLRPDMTLEPIRNYHGLFSLETHPTKKLDVYAYYGGEYAQRTVYTTPQGALIGYGPRNLNNSGCYALPTNSGNGSGTAGSIAATACASPTRYIQEGMLGFTYRLASSPKYGRLQYQATYQYLQRNLWSGTATTPGLTTTGPRALDNMFHMGMRYYIP
ncbi:hypothetical protein Terro_1030 [Terriglobus roseus DSM 18391]|uniref:Uncharacterized protein n=1 Tax=Terriglobus roseus (strain DSM 18391 / NRRL B-41598 / KBS 63) TaxID=926566 RepID=I3ZDN3_TERRK|nr:hypothetical protein [Terriglobus roseus]AFL87351.1 hypothetical protein Terro_1030 [Terriglobus roseus DSM 18391]